MGGVSTLPGKNVTRRLHDLDAIACRVFPCTYNAENTPILDIHDHFGVLGNNSEPVIARTREVSITLANAL